MRIKIGTAANFPAETLVTVQGDKLNLVAARINGKIYAAHSSCPHMGLPLDDSELQGSTLTCSRHGSQFDLTTGQNLAWVPSIGGIKLPDWSRGFVALGKEPTSLKMYPIIEEGGEVFVEL